MASKRGGRVIRVWKRVVAIIARSRICWVVAFSASGLRPRILRSVWWSVCGSPRTFIGVATDRRISSSSGTERAR